MKHSDLIALNGFVVVISFIYGFTVLRRCGNVVGSINVFRNGHFCVFLLLSSEKVKNLKDIQIIFLGCYTLHVIR